MSPVEQTPLLNGRRRQNQSLYFKLVKLIEADGEPSWIDSYRWFIFGSWLNLLLLLVPVAAASHYLNWDAPLRFGFSFIAIVPLAKLLGDATEQMSLSLGQTLAGLLNATFGNAVEIIVGLTALLQGEVRIVQTSMLGSILSNILLVLGCSFLAGGIYIHESEFQVTAAQTSSHIACALILFAALVIPAAYHSAKHVISPVKGNLMASATDPLISDLDESAQKGLLIISRGTAILLLGVYIAYLIFQLKTHASLFIAKPKPRDAEAHTNERAPELEETPKMSVVAAGLGLLVVTIITSLVADYLVASIEETANRFEIPKSFIGLILLPIVANAAEHVTSVWMAMKDKMELTIGICIGSSIQIATFVVPLLVVVGWISGHELTLFFDDFETVAFFVSVLLVNLLIQDGKSNYMEGLMLITLYLVIALACTSSHIFFFTS
ncbi:Calcium/proton exchanger [Multifurca ochricompacta]|uniref:Vacuolar calcium ion transporter n=1 Tax=Multifurca ochricompacta TaxID=376703 RepID=A0AAD4M9R8_9AGAM|nr:Calcium/proton exchanger [Multifurca ochricompacta]